MRKNFIRSAALILSAAFALSLAGCSSDKNNNDSAAEDTAPAAETSAESTSANSDNGETSNAEILNFIPPEEGEKIVVITVKDYGEIKIKLFPEAAPEAVENFIGLAEMNYYDELIFHRVIPGFMIQGGDPRGDGTGGNSLWGGNFDGGIPEGLYHFSGAVAYANSAGPSTNGSQFYIVDTADSECYLGGVQNEDGSVYYYQTFEEAGISIPQNVAETYYEKGGTPSLDGGYTVFGQVFEGLDIVRQIAEVETDPSNDKPLKQVVMESVRVVEYTAEE